MLLQITESGLPCHGKPACKCLYRTCQKWNFVLAHINSLQLSAAKLQQKNDIRKNVHHFCGIFPVSLFLPSATNTDRTKTCFSGFSTAH